jgi:hypothetical protein
MLHNKKGQFYIILSVLLAVAVFGVTSNSNTIKEAILFEDFEDLSDNYIQESEYVINYALESKLNVEDLLNEFTQDYLDYSEQKNPNLQLLYVYSDGENVYLANYFNGPIQILGEEEIPGAEQQLMQDIFIEIGGKEYSYKVPIKTEDFGYDWYTGQPPTNFDLSVAGFLHPFDLSADGPEFNVIIYLEEGEIVIPVGDGSGEYPRESPPGENVKNIVRQVKIR